MAKKHLSAASLFRCTFGTIPMISKPKKKHVTMNGLQVMTTNDKDFVKSFGMCLSTGQPKPCSPKLTQWVNFEPTQTFRGGKALTTDSFIMCALMGKVAPVNSAQKAARVQGEDIICPLCNKSYLKHDFKIEGTGNYIGVPETLGNNMISRFKHEWNNHGSIAAHHLICAHLVNDSHKDDIWNKIVYVHDYDINRKENGVWLTMSMTLACYLRIPLHFSNHGSGFGGTIYIANEKRTITYYKAVKEKVDNINEKYQKEDKPCDKQDHDNFIRDMNDASKFIYGKIEKFAWTLTYDAVNYTPASLIGCGSKSLISEKQEEVANLAGLLGGNKASIAGFRLTKNNIDNVRDVRDDLLEKITPCGCGRAHTEHVYVVQRKLKYGGNY